MKRIVAAAVLAIATASPVFAGDVAGIPLTLQFGDMDRAPVVHKAPKQVSGYAPKTLKQKFKDAYGIDVSRFARARRCEEIVRLIRGSEDNLGDIGRRCGFDSASAFCNFVVRNTGISPAEHRRRRSG